MHTKMEYYSSIRKRKIVSCRKIDVSRDQHVKKSIPDTEIKRYHVFSHMSRPKKFKRYKSMRDTIWEEDGDWRIRQNKHGSWFQ